MLRSASGPTATASGSRPTPGTGSRRKPRPSTSRRRAARLVLLLPLTAVAVVAVEVLIARSGRMLPPRDLAFADGCGAGDCPLAVWLGDSTAAGVGVEQGEDAVPSLVARARGERPLVLAVSGASIGDVVADQLPRLAKVEPAVVYVSVGSNDVTHLTSRASFRRHYRRLLAALPDGARVVLLGVPDMGSPTRLAQPLRALAGWRGRQLDRIVRELARVSGATYVDIAGSTGPSFRRAPDRHFAADRYHPNAVGYELWASAVVAATRPPDPSALSPR